MIHLYTLLQVPSTMQETSSNFLVLKSVNVLTDIIDNDLMKGARSTSHGHMDYPLSHKKNAKRS